MAIKLLVGGWDSVEIEKIKELSIKQDVEDFIILNKKDEDIIIGDLVKNANNEISDILDERLILFYGFTNKQISKFIDNFKLLNLDYPLFAMVTPHSIKWNLRTLLEHLKEERKQAIANRKKK
jgi:hypothetical protein